MNATTKNPESHHKPLLATVAVAAQLLDCSEEYTRRRLRKGQIRGHKLGSDWRIPFKELARIVYGGINGPEVEDSATATLFGHLSPEPPTVEPLCPASESLPPMLSEAEVATWLRVPKAKVKELALGGRLPGVQVGDAYRFSLDAIQAFVGSPKSAPAASTSAQ